MNAHDWELVVSRLQLHWSHDKHLGGSLYLFLRGSRKKKWKRYRTYHSRGRMRGKRPISMRLAGAENRSRVGHLEVDTVIGAFDRHCILTLVDRKTGYVMIGKLFGRTAAATNRRAAALAKRPQRTIGTKLMSPPPASLETKV